VAPRRRPLGRLLGRRAAGNARQGPFVRRAARDREPFAVVEQFERVSVKELLADGVGPDVDPQPPTAVDEAERQAGQSRRQARSE
jgi:hypothetical protein